MSFPKNAWKAHYFAPARSDNDVKGYTTLTLFNISGFMTNPLTTQLGKSISNVARVNHYGYLTFNFLHCNGLGPIEEMKGLQFDQMVESIVQMLLHPKFNLGEFNKLVIVGHSLGGWEAVLVAVHERLRGLVGAVLLLAPAVGVLLPYYFQKVMELQHMGKVQQLNELEAGEIVRVDNDFKEDVGFPLSYKFQRTSLGLGLGGPDLNLNNLTVPVTIIVGEEDPRVTPTQVEELFNRIPAGNKKLIRVSLLEHSSFEDKAIFGSVVRPELERLAIEALPNLARSTEEGHKELMQGLDQNSWGLVRKAFGKRAYRHLTTGKTYQNKEGAKAFERELNDKDAKMRVCGDPTEERFMWTEGRTEVELLNHQQYQFDFIPEGHNPAME